MFAFLRLFTLLLALCCTLPAYAEDAAIAGLFAKAGVSGTLLIESAAGDRRFVHDDARAQKPFTPASTFKILNTLIAIEHGAELGSFDRDFGRFPGLRFQALSMDVVHEP